MGLTLIEMLIGLLLSAIVLTGVVLLAVRVSVAGGDVAGSFRLNQQARMVLNQVSGELQRAGYLNWFQSWDDCVDTVTPTALDDLNADGTVNILDFYQCSLPAIDLVGAISLWDFPVPGDAGSGSPMPCTDHCDCVLYSYDFNQDGAQGIGNGIPGANQNTANFELFAFRWNDGALERRTSGSLHSCNSGSWRDLNDSKVVVDDMGFSLRYATSQGNGNHSTMFQLAGDGSWNGSFQNSCSPFDSDTSDPTPLATDSFCIVSRAIDVSIGAGLSGDNTVNIALATTVGVRNNHLNVP